MIYRGTVWFLLYCLLEHTHFLFVAFLVNHVSQDVKQNHSPTKPTTLSSTILYTTSYPRSIYNKDDVPQANKYSITRQDSTPWPSRKPWRLYLLFSTLTRTCLRQKPTQTLLPASFLLTSGLILVHSHKLEEIRPYFNTQTLRKNLQKRENPQERYSYTKIKKLYLFTNPHKNLHCLNTWLNR